MFLTDSPSEIPYFVFYDVGRLRVCRHQGGAPVPCHEAHRNRFQCCAFWTTVRCQRNETRDSCRVSPKKNCISICTIQHSISTYILVAESLQKMGCLPTGPSLDDAVLQVASVNENQLKVPGSRLLGITSFVHSFGVQCVHRYRLGKGPCSLLRPWTHPCRAISYWMLGKYLGIARRILFNVQPTDSLSKDFMLSCV